MGKAALDSQTFKTKGSFLDSILRNEVHNFFALSSKKNSYSSAKRRFTSRFPQIGTEYYSALTHSVLDRIYPKFCRTCGNVRLSVPIKGRETIVRCPQCHLQGSRTAYTPLHHFKLPLWTFGYVLSEAVLRYPAVLSGSEIQRRLGCSNNTAALLKRRLQLFLSDLMPAVKEELREEVENRLKKFKLPAGEVDLAPVVKDFPVVNMDTCALFSASQRANAGRSRYKHTGQTASIYLSDKVSEVKGKYQIGTLVHTMAVKKGPVILDCIRDQKQRTIQPLLDFLPAHTPTFTDEGYPWLSKYNRNHRAVNHSARAKDRKRNAWARNRWCRNGVNNQAAEGFQRNLKHSFIAGYSYVSPEYAPLYLNEYASIKNLKHYGLKILGDRIARIGVCEDGEKETLPPPLRGSTGRRDSYLKDRIGLLKYQPPTSKDRLHLDLRDSRRRIAADVKAMLDDPDFFEARQAHIDYLNFWDDAALYRKQAENKYNAVAREFWKRLHRYDERSVSRIAEQMKVPHRLLLRIVRKWARFKMVRVRETRTASTRVIQYSAHRLTQNLPAFLYSFDLKEFMNQPEKHDHVALIEEAQTPKSKYRMHKNQRLQYIKEMNR